jgi:hypothetical protein
MGRCRDKKENNMRITEILKWAFPEKEFISVQAKKEMMAKDIIKYLETWPEGDRHEILSAVVRSVFPEPRHISRNPTRKPF